MSTDPEPTQPAATPGEPAPGAASGGALESQPFAGVSTGRKVGKTRNPWGVWLLTFITLGIYGLY